MPNNDGILNDDGSLYRKCIRRKNSLILDLWEEAILGEIMKKNTKKTLKKNNNLYVRNSEWFDLEHMHAIQEELTETKVVKR